MKTLFFIIFLTASISVNFLSAQRLADFRTQAPSRIMENTIHNNFQFNGYTNYWHDIYREWIRYGNLFKMANSNIPMTIAQSKRDLADDMGVPGLKMQEGFIAGLLSEPYEMLDQPTIQELEDRIKENNVLVLLDPVSDAGKVLMEKYPDDLSGNEKLKSHQLFAVDYSAVDAFYLENEGRRIFVISAENREAIEKVQLLIENTIDVVNKYDLHRGWFGVKTLLKSVTCTAGHPLEVMGKGMNEGNTWFVFDGYMDFLAKDELKDWLTRVNLPIVSDVGFSPIYGCRDYEGLQVQSLFTKESWIDYAHSKGGYIFRDVFDTLADPFQYHGYLAGEGNKEQIDQEEVPFVSSTGQLDRDASNCMVLFLNKGDRLTNDTMWEAILSRREVAVLEMGKMMGPALYRNTLEMLLLDRAYLEEYFGDKVSLEAEMDNYQMNLTITNFYQHPLKGKLEIVLSPELSMDAGLSFELILPANSSKTLSYPIKPSADAMDGTNPIAVHYQWETSKKSTLTMLDLPPVVSVHQLLYDHASQMTYPVTIHNFSSGEPFPVQLEVLDMNKQGKVILKNRQTCSAPVGTYKNMAFDIKLPAGNYQVNVSALGVTQSGQLGVGKASGRPYVYEVDLNSDGVMEYRMENDSVQVTLLATGARVIEYIVKSRNDNVLFKLWPEKAVDDRREFRKRGYYPYGGFEDFLGQGSMETHKVYDAEIVRKEGDFVRVKMAADYFGNRLEKTFTLYGNSPLLEVRFALTFKNPEANVLGPQPILELGNRHWTEDVFIIPELDGLSEYRMKPERYYGRVFHMKEGWNAGYDTMEDITFVGAFPVTQPLFLHMWMNHPVNNDAHHYYAEFQPWTPIYQKSTMYFSYYIWGAGGPWENGVNALRDRNLISTR
ncbi:MAG: hypothetical protein KFF73_13880 [Cyclobacteriaceae bacterium]|nr:hypothetical protein [Cyclobacteriaceae bacterium]